MTVNQIETIPCNIESCGGGFSTITFTLPDDNVNGFVALLTSLAALFRGLGWKTKTNIDSIHEREDARRPGREQRILEYETATRESYLDFIKRGNSPRESLSLTVSAVGFLYAFSSYDNIKKILIKNKLLKNTGFYSTKHKFFSDDEK